MKEQIRQAVENGMYEYWALEHKPVRGLDQEADQNSLICLQIKKIGIEDCIDVKGFHFYPHKDTDIGRPYSTAFTILVQKRFNNVWEIDWYTVGWTYHPHDFFAGNPIFTLEQAIKFCENINITANKHNGL